MSPFAIEAIERLACRLETNAGQLVIDADTHVTDPECLAGERKRKHESSPDYFHGRTISAEELIVEMDGADVDMAVIWQNPAATAYTGNRDDNARSLLAANRYIRDAAARHPGRFIPGGWVDPKACGLERALAMVETLVCEYGFPIVKFNPAQNEYRIDSTKVLAVVDRIVSLGAVPAFHFGADTPYTPAEGLRHLAERHPAHPLLAVHMGGGGASYPAAEELYLAARKLGLEHRNIHYVLSAKRDAHMESDLITYQLAGDPYCRHLFCASDAPYGRVAWNFGGFRAMFGTLMDGARHTDPRVRAHAGLFTPVAVQNYLGGNFARFAAESCRRLLGARQPCPA